MLAKIAMYKQATSTTPAGRLSQTMRVGNLKRHAPPGPSIHQVSGAYLSGVRPLAGTKKSSI